MWDRSKQKYWISRLQDPWKVISMTDNRPVCDCPSIYDTDFLEKICFAEDDTQIFRTIEDYNGN